MGTRAEWGEVPGFPGVIVSDRGSVISPLGNSLSGAINTGGYRQVSVVDESGRRRLMLVHRLVAMAFIPNPKGLGFVNHRNGNKTDNRTTNLEWCTQGGNVRHAWRTGLCSLTPRRLAALKANREKVDHAKRRSLSPAQVQALKYDLLEGMRQVDAAQKYGVSQSTVSNIKRGAYRV